MNLERYSFLWSEVRLVIAAIALFIGGVPPVWYLVTSPALFGAVRLGLTLAWIVSGVASVYLLYEWNARGRMVFGGKAPRDTAAFFIATISGINLGIAGLIGRNIGISISSNYFIFVVVAVAYLVSAGYLWSRWKARGEKLFA